MSAISVRLPEWLHDQARDMADREKTSINQLVALALAEKLSALRTEEYLSERGARGSRRKFLAVLAKVPARLPVAADRLACGASRRKAPPKNR